MSGTQIGGSGGVISPFGSGLQLQAATPVAGFALQNATPNILTWTAPADGANHRAEIIGEVAISSGETGGQIQVQFTDPGGTSRTLQLVNGGLGSGVQVASFAGNNSFVVKSGTAVNVNQSSALTGGAATAYLEIWGS